MDINFNYKFYVENYQKTYPKFLNKLKEYCEKYEINYCDKNVEKVVSNEKLFNDLLYVNTAFNFNYDVDDISEQLFKKKKILFGEEKIDIIKVWKKINSGEKNKILIFMKLLSKTSDELIKSSTEFIKNNFMVENDKSFSVDDLINNKNKLVGTDENTKNETGNFLNIQTFSLMLNKILVNAGFNKDYFEDAFVKFKEYSKNPDFNKLLIQQAKEFIGEKNCDKNLESLITDMAKEITTNNDIDIKLNSNDLLSGLTKFGANILNKKKLKKYAKNADPKKLMDIAMNGIYKLSHMQQEKK